VSELIIKGARKLTGEVNIHGAKNSALPILASAILNEGDSIIHNCPKLSDVTATINILEYLGCKVKVENSDITINTDSVSQYYIPDFLMREMRSSIIFLGAIVSKMGKAKLCFPGGCEIGLRPIDLHLKALRQMGMKIDESHGFINCSVDGRLKGSNIALSFPSVGATENIIIAATLAQGETTITNAAREPEITDLSNYLNSCGAKIRGFGEGVIKIEGVNKLKGCEHTAIPDRIEAITFMCAAAATKSKIKISNINIEHLGQINSLFEEADCKLKAEKDSLIITAPQRLRPIKIVRTMPYPGFPTDAQAPVMSIASIASGTSVFIENIFENRYKHIGELNRMGATISSEGRVAIVEGVDNLYGTSVKAPDLRAAAALIVAGISAKGTTTLSGLDFLDRGYENIEGSLSKLGADIVRI
jgi:UDP-N-acetylglucosamine 1-carboxyvinyltransferase